jgi:hypothetical protein
MGTGKWTSKSSRTRPPSTCTVTGFQSAPRLLSIETPLPPSNAAIPSEHHAQLAHQLRSPWRTVKQVGAVENGCITQISGQCGCKTTP